MGNSGTLNLEIGHRLGTCRASLSSSGKSLLEIRGKDTDVQLPLPEVSLRKGPQLVELWVFDGQTLVVLDGSPSRVLEIPPGLPELEAPYVAGFGSDNLLLDVEELGVAAELPLYACLDDFGPPVTVSSHSYLVASESQGRPTLIPRDQIEGPLFLLLSESPPRIRPAR